MRHRGVSPAPRALPRPGSASPDAARPRPPSTPEQHPLPRRAAPWPGPARPARELAVRALVAAAYGATHMMTDDPADASPAQTSSVGGGPGTAIPVVRAGDWAYDPAADVWRPLALIEAGAERGDLSPGELGDLLDAGAQMPAWFTPPAVARELRRARPPRAERGFVLFLTGLSRSGKSTIARDLRDALAERGDR